MWTPCIIGTFTLHYSNNCNMYIALCALHYVHLPIHISLFNKRRNKELEVAITRDSMEPIKRGAGSRSERQGQRGGPSKTRNWGIKMTVVEDILFHQPQREVYEGQTTGVEEQGSVKVPDTSVRTNCSAGTVEPKVACSPPANNLYPH